MKRRLFALLLVLALCLSICACKKNGDEQPTQTISGSTENAQNTEPSKVTDNTKNTESADNTEPTEAAEATEPPKPTEPPVVELSVADWQLEEPDYLSYEEYFSVEREYCGDLFYASTKWVKGDQVYYLQHLQQNGKTPLEVVCYEPKSRYTVPNTLAYEKYYTAGADGRYAYMYNHSQFLQIDLATGEAEVLLTGSSLGVRLVDNLVLYYTYYKDNELTIGRLYLPTRKNDILHKTQGEFYNLALQKPKTNKSPLVWELWNPEFINFLKVELSNPNSKIKKGEDYDLSHAWDNADPFAYVLDSPMALHLLQDAGGQQALMKCTYDFINDKLTKQVATMCHCFYGSGCPYDHYNAHITTAPEPEVLMGGWAKVVQEAPFLLCLSSDSNTAMGNAVKQIGVDSQIYLYAKTDGDYKKLVSPPIKDVVDTGSCAIYLSADRKSVVAVSYDGTQSIELYRSVHGAIIDMDLGLGKTRLLLQDGDTLVAMDLSAAQYREVLKHQYLRSYSFGCDYMEGKHIDTDKIYLELCAGMYYAGYTLDIKTGELKEAGRRL